MIIYGSNKTKLKQGSAKNLTCSHCNSIDTINVIVLGKYIHLFWIPFFPTSKKAISVCSHCKNTLEEKEMPSSYKTFISEIKKDSRKPVWHFLGLGLTLILITWVYFSVKANSKKMVEFINNPKVGDTYEYKNDIRDYTTMKVARISNDSIYLFMNDYSINKVAKIHKIDKQENYNLKEVHGFSKEEIIQMHQNGKIIAVNR